ncbi:MAG: protein kinase [Acidobacteriota bacterium]
MTKKIGKYEISEQIGVGGFGAVYRGRDPFIKRTVAVKTCQLNDEEIRSRFFREAELAGNLHHRNITTIYDFGVEEGVPYIVQEFLTGEDLDKIVKRGEQLSVPRKIEILMSIADGLGYAHRQSIIHRDIKPSNIRILDDGSVKIMDFGIAKSLLSESSLTQTGITLGTSAYLAPEQIRGEGLDGRTDLFSLGILAYELLTQRKPFRGEHLSTVLYKILNDTPEPITSLAPAVPASLAEVVSRAMEKSADSRYASMEAFRQDLQTVYRELVGDSSQFLTNPNSGSPLTPTRGVSAAEANPAPRTPSRGTTVGPRPPIGVTPPSGALARVRAETYDHTPTQVAIPLPPANLELVHFQEPADRTTAGRTGSGGARGRGPGWVLWAGTAAVAVLGVLFAAWKLSSHAGTARAASAPAISGRSSGPRPAAEPVLTAPIAFPSPQLGRDAVPAAPTAVPIPAAAKPAEPAAVPAPEPARPARRFPVQFSSIPSATLYVDGRKVGPSIPARTVELTQGAHQVRFEGAGLPRYQKDFQVGSSGAAPIAYRFPIGALVIEAPAWSGATVLIDSKFHGVLSGALTVSLPSGTHKITLSRAGWNPHTAEVAIPEGEKKTWSPPAPTEHAQ